MENVRILTASNRLMRVRLIPVLVFVFLSIGCTPNNAVANSATPNTLIQATNSPQPLITSTVPSLTPEPSASPTATVDYTPTPDTRPLPQSWSSWPILPQMTDRAREIYEQGLEMGNDPNVFSIIGDCQSEPPVLFGIYATDRYFLGEDFQYLQDTIDYFAGNFDRDHVTVKNGLSVASVFSPLWADENVCEESETPLECEFRLHRPSFVFINLGTNWMNSSSAAHEELMRQIVDFVIAHGVVPILSTKADNQEGDNTINLSIARIAYEYDLPLWNFWAAVQDLPNHGLDDARVDKNYLIPDAWDRRSFTGLRVLDRVWQFVTQQ